MTAHASIRLVLALAAGMCVFLLAGQAYAGGAQMVVVVTDGAGEGFNDPTPAAPVGGNTGTTLGAQRLFAFQYAANIWGARLDSNVPVRVQASFDPLAPNVLGSAGAMEVFRDFPGLVSGRFFPGAEFARTWYGVALANKRAGVDLDPASNDIQARFSSNFNFYLGVDNNAPANQPDLVTVLLHELAHGLGFQTFTNNSNGIPLAGFTDVFARRLLDLDTGQHWNDLTDAQRKASATSTSRLLWDGPAVTADVPSVLTFGSPEVRITAPASVARLYGFGTAAFGPQLATPPITGNVVVAQDAADAAGPSTLDGCTALTNAADVAGNIALVQRGTCGFVVKSKVAQDAGAIAVIIDNQQANENAAAPGMAGVDPSIVIPSVSLNYPDGQAIRTAAGTSTVTASLGVNTAVRAGADPSGRARMYAPFPLVVGSSVSHYDTVASRNLLMEPAINPDLTHNVSAPDDLTLELLSDIGWFPDTDFDGIANASDCNATSNLAATVVIGGNDSKVPNTLFSSGCSMSDLIAQAAAVATSHDDFVQRVAALAVGWKKSGLITGAQQAAIVNAASRARLP